MSEDRRRLGPCLVLGVPSLLGGLDALAGIDIPPGRVLALAFALAFYVFAAGSITAHVVSRQDVVTDTLFGAACAYLLVGFVWTLAYTLLERLQPGSFSVAALAGPAGPPLVSDSLYYSFVTLTMLG